MGDNRFFLQSDVIVVIYYAVVGNVEQLVIEKNKLKNKELRIIMMFSDFLTEKNRCLKRSKAKH